MRLCALAFVALLSSSVSFAADNASSFPFRAKYPDLPIISEKELSKEFYEVIIVDVRSNFEYNVVHINDAKLVPVTNMEFLDNLQKVRGKQGQKKLVFYCNGHQCEKSYEAGKAAKDGGFENFQVFDAGIFDWINAHPEKSTMFGKTPVDPSKILSHKQLEAHLVDFQEIKSAAGKPNVDIIDVREPKQRAQKEIKLPGLRLIPLDTLKQAIEARKFQDKSLYFIDAVGKQNEWLQYYLVQFGYTNYKFLKGGAASIQ